MTNFFYLQPIVLTQLAPGTAFASKAFAFVERVGAGSTAISLITKLDNAFRIVPATETLISTHRSASAGDSGLDVTAPKVGTQNTHHSKRHSKIPQQTVP